MRQTFVKLIGIQRFATFAQLRFEAGAWARGLEAGCAVLARLQDAYLRRTWWPCAMDASGFSILVDSAYSAGLRAGDSIDVIGPVGRGFRVADLTRRLLLIATESNAPAPAIAPLLPLIARALASNREVTLAYAIPEDMRAYPLSALPPALEVIGVEGEDLLPHLGDALAWADQIFCCGSREWTQRVSAHVARMRLRTRPEFMQVLNMLDLPCGLGVCRACWNGSRLACVAGPVFDA